ncbi:MAG: hypothetical protein AABZ36_01005 [Nitrospirota bacterium]
MNDTTIDLLIKREASASVGNSTLRSQGAKDVVESARKSLAKIKIEKYSITSTQKEFIEILDKDTQEIMRALPSGAQNWGAARKVINIFLRNLIYNKHICQKHKIDHIESWLEIPLDSHVAEGLSETDSGRNLPRWNSIKRLTKADSDQYQLVAYTIAEKLKINRIDLDIYLWRKIGIELLKNV